MSELECASCEYNHTIGFQSQGEVVAYVPICMKAKATRSVMDKKPHWCPIDGTGNPYSYVKKLESRVQELEKTLGRIRAYTTVKWIRERCTEALESRDLTKQLGE